MRLFSADDVKTTVAHDMGDGELILETQQNVDDILERNKILKAEDSERTGHLKDFHLVASIPDAAIVELNKMGIMRGFAVMDEPGLKKWLNKPENNVWKIYRGRL